MTHEGQEEEGREVEEVGSGGPFAPPNSPLQRSLPRLRKPLPLFSPYPPAPLPQHPPPPPPSSPHPPHHPMPSLALPHAPHPQESVVQHQGLQSFGRWELKCISATAAHRSPSLHIFKQWIMWCLLLLPLSQSFTSLLSFPPFCPHPLTLNRGEVYIWSALMDQLLLLFFFSFVLTMSRDEIWETTFFSFCSLLFIILI